MKHSQFMQKVLEQAYTPEMTSRLAVEKAIIPAGWCRQILEGIPEARDYLKKRSPEAMKQLEQAEKRFEKAGKPRTPQRGEER